MNSINFDYFENLESSLGYVFKDKGLLTEALTHSSYSYENNLSFSYERFEFFGDAVIEMIISEYIFKHYPDFDEGKMSSLRAYIVSENSLVKVAENVSVADFIYLGKGEAAETGKNIKKSILADVVEAIIAAIYLDSGYSAAQEIFIKHMEKYVIQGVENYKFLNARNEVQIICQKYFNKIPNYILVSETGQDHDKCYCVETDMCGLSYGKGFGSSKKEAEKAAAEAALKAYLQQKNNA